MSICKIYMLSRLETESRHQEQPGKQEVPFVKCQVPIAFTYEVPTFLGTYRQVGLIGRYFRLLLEVPRYVL